MTSLQEIQESLQQFLIQENMGMIIPHISSTENLSAEARLGIYSDAYMSRLTEALATNYSFLQSCLGNAGFRSLSESYIRNHPSCYRSIRWFGDKLPELMLKRSEYLTSYYLCEIAKLEWLLTLVFDAEDCTVVLMDQMSDINPAYWQGMKLKFHPSVHHTEFKWNVVEFWQSSLNDERSIPLKEHTEPTGWIFWRKDLINHFNSLSKHESWAMNAALSGLTFAEICEGLCQFMDESNVAITAAGMLKNWITSGMVSEIIL